MPGSITDLRLRPLRRTQASKGLQRALSGSYTSILCSLVLMSLLLTAAPSAASWPPYGAPVCTYVGHQVDVAIVPDGRGGTIIVWKDFRNDAGDIYAQRLDAAGARSWSSVGVPICTATRDQWEPRAVPDGAGGATVAWRDWRNPNYEIYAQRVDSLGNRLWTPDGVYVHYTDGMAMEMAPDGTGGAIMAFTMYRPFPEFSDVRAQRVNAYGDTTWGDQGLGLGVHEAMDHSPTVVADGQGGAVIAWCGGYQTRTYEGVIAQRVDSTGNRLWDPDNVPVSMVYAVQDRSQAVTDEKGGAIVAWAEHRAPGLVDIFAQRVDLNGNPLWPGDVIICYAGGEQEEFDIVADGKGGAIVAWKDEREPTQWDIYAQRVDSTGTTLWAYNGRPVCTNPSRQSAPRVAPDGAGGAYVAWADERHGDWDIYAQHIKSSGLPVWEEDGRQVCARSEDQEKPGICWDDSTGPVVAWQDRRNTADYDIYASVADPSGEFGDAPDGVIAYPGPMVTGLFATCANSGTGYIHHFRNDEIHFGPGIDFETEGNDDWCRSTPLQPYDADECFGDGDAGLMFPPAYTIDAMGSVVPCVPDSTGSIGPTCSLAVWGSTIDIQVVNASPRVAYVSALIDWDGSGRWLGADTCSKKVLAPEVILTNFPVPELYSGSLSALGPPSFRIGSTEGPVWARFTVSSDSLMAGAYWNGEGEFADGETEDYLLMVSNDVSSIGPGEPGGAFRLHPTSPNPFTTLTAVRYELPDVAHVRISIYDATGRLVRRLAEGVRPAGPHDATWDGTDRVGHPVSAGVYFCRIEAGEFTATRRMVLLR